MPDVDVLQPMPDPDEQRSWPGPRETRCGKLTRWQRVRVYVTGSVVVATLLWAVWNYGVLRLFYEPIDPTPTGPDTESPYRFESAEWLTLGPESAPTYVARAPLSGSRYEELEPPPEVGPEDEVRVTHAEAERWCRDYMETLRAAHPGAFREGGPLYGREVGLPTEGEWTAASRVAGFESDAPEWLAGDAPTSALQTPAPVSGGGEQPHASVRLPFRLVLRPSAGEAPR